MTRVLLTAFLAPAALCLAQAPTGSTLQLEGKSIPLPFTAALLRDNAEGQLDHPQELRILLTDAAVDPELIQGLHPAFDLAPLVEAGRVKGLLLTMNPSTSTSVVVTLLAPPKQPGMSLLNQTLTKTPDGPFARFTYQPGRVKGLLEPSASEGSEDMPAFGYKAEFDLPVSPSPAITEDVKGKAALVHPTVAALKARAQCMAKGDAEGALRFSAPASLARDRAFLTQSGTNAKAMFPAMGKELLKALGKVDRVIVRGSSATVLLPDQNSFRLRKVEGAWKVE